MAKKNQIGLSSIGIVICTFLAIAIAAGSFILATNPAESEFGKNLIVNGFMGFGVLLVLILFSEAK